MLLRRRVSRWCRPILTAPCKRSDPRVTLQDAFDLFRRLGVHPETMSRSDFSMAYYQLARRFHPDVNPATNELMANINAARTEILQSYRRSI